MTTRPLTSDSHGKSDLPLDVIIVGGGPSGLSAALVLGRCLRQVLLCDIGHPRNAPATVFNGYLSRDGSSPQEFYRVCREQLSRYETVQQRTVEVIDAVPGKDRFIVTLSTGEKLTSRMLLLATGLFDKLPEIEGLRERYGKSVHSCPYCDGWEVRGQPLAVIGSCQHSADLAIELLLWSQDVVLCTNGGLHCDETSLRQIRRCGIQVDERKIARLEGDNLELHRIHFADGTFIERSAAFISPEQHQRSHLPERLGCKFCEDGCIDSAEDGSTCIPGLYAVGNASRGVQLVIAAAAEGTLAAVAINNALLEVDAEKGILGCD